MPLRFSEALPEDEQQPAPSTPKASKGGARKSIYGAVYDARPPAADQGSRRTSEPKREQAKREPERERKPRERDSKRKPDRERKRSGRRGRARDDRDDRDDREQQRPPRSDRRDRRRRGAAQEAKAHSEELAKKKSSRLPIERPLNDSGFARFNLSREILAALDDMGWENPSEIQEQMIPRVLEGSDVVGQARTGTGKTGAFAIPVLELYQGRGNQNVQGRKPKVIALTPTRELALQIDGQFRELGAYLKVRTVAVYGGAPMEPQIRGMRSGCDVIVGTPGRIMDHIRRGNLDLSSIACFVLDEADRMFDLGFRDDIYWIARRMPKEKRQTVLLSATVPPEVLSLAKEVTENPEVIRTATKDLTVGTVEQFYIPVDPERKLGLLEHLVAQEDPEKGIVFTRTKRGADKIAERLRKKGFDAAEIHGDLRQRQRERVLSGFREGGLHLMIATDVAARGLDIKGVSHVINYDVPEHAEDYVHRVGRTARMGKKGRAFTFITKYDGGFLTQIEKLINKEVPHFKIDGYRCEASAEEIERRERRSRPAAEHPMAGKFSPALLSILNNRRSGGGKGGKGGGRGGGKGGRGGGRGGGKGGRGRR